MPVQRLNHAVLYVRDVDVSLGHYRDVLGFRVVHSFPGRAAFLRAPDSTNDHDLGLFAIGAAASDSGAGRTSVGLYHLAWEVDTLAELARLRAVLAAHDALTGQSDHGATKSLYTRDPDGIESEICWVVPAALLGTDGPIGTFPLDLDAEIERFGAETPGGIGVSVPA